MPFQTQILALNPSVYWPLDTGDVSGLLDVSGHGINASKAGDVVHNAFGSEMGKQATQLFPSGVIQSPALGWAGGIDFSMLFVAAMKGVANGAGFLPVLRIGDAANAVLHGLGLAWGTNTSGFAYIEDFNGLLLTPMDHFSMSMFHLYGMTYTAATRSLSVFADNTIQAAVRGTAVPAFTATDQFIVPYTTPLVVTHVAAFQRVLTNAEIGSVASVVAQWPFQVPVSSQQGGSTDEPVTIDPSDPTIGLVLSNQSTYMPQIANTQTLAQQIHDFWTNYISVTLPSLNTMLSNILGGLTSTVTDAAGHVWQEGLSALHEWGDPGHFVSTGSDMVLTDCGVLDAPVHDPLLANFGIQLHASVVPDGFGLADGYVTRFQERLGQFLLVREAGGSDLGPHYTDVLDLHLQDYTWLFTTKQAVQLAYCIAPGVTIVARWTSTVPG